MAEARKTTKGVTSWKKVAGDAPWVGGQSSSLNPGSETAIAKRRNSGKYKARGKKVSKPRIQKHHNPDTKKK